MTNDQIAEIIELTGKLLELHDRDEMRSKTYLGSIYNLERLESDLYTLSESELLEIRGIGKLMAKNILEIVNTGTLSELEVLVSETPQGVLDMFKVKGLGVKKIKILWHDQGILNLEELKKACENGTIANTKGFGEKTQISILESLVFIQSQKGKLRIDKAQVASKQIFEKLQVIFKSIEEVGQIIQKNETVDVLAYILKDDEDIFLIENLSEFEENLEVSSPFCWRGNLKSNAIAIEIHLISESEWVNKKFQLNSNIEHLKFKNSNDQTLMSVLNSRNFESEADIYSSFGFPLIIPEMRENLNEFEWSQKHEIKDLISLENLKGCLHNHSKYSDGVNTVKEMADYCLELGLEYFGIADHSQTAQYAQGLEPSRVLKQQIEIDELNKAYKGFKILKGIESDILPNGDLDYDSDILKSFDYVVASVHSVLNMDLEKATSRLIKAIENPYTTILGHPTGRLLLSRKGYPIDYKKIIDACAANKVVMEINASPYRLDIDWRLIPYCMEKGVMLSINPDAHSLVGIHDMKYGVEVARKGGLLKSFTFNALSLVEIENWLSIKKGSN
jgi:DNA polymerase (family X)